MQNPPVSQISSAMNCGFPWDPKNPGYRDTLVLSINSEIVNVDNSHVRVASLPASGSPQADYRAVVHSVGHDGRDILVKMLPLHRCFHRSTSSSHSTLSAWPHSAKVRVTAGPGFTVESSEDPLVGIDVENEVSLAFVTAYWPFYASYERVTNGFDPVIRSLGLSYCDVAYTIYMESVRLMQIMLARGVRMKDWGCPTHAMERWVLAAVQVKLYEYMLFDILGTGVNATTRKRLGDFEIERRMGSAVPRSIMDRINKMMDNLLRDMDANLMAILGHSGASFASGGSRVQVPRREYAIFGWQNFSHIPGFEGLADWHHNRNNRYVITGYASSFLINLYSLCSSTMSLCSDKVPGLHELAVHNWVSGSEVFQFEARGPGAGYANPDDIPDLSLAGYVMDTDTGQEWEASASMGAPTASGIPVTLTIPDAVMSQLGTGTYLWYIKVLGQVQSASDFILVEGPLRISAD